MQVGTHVGQKVAEHSCLRKQCPDPAGCAVGDSRVPEVVTHQVPLSPQPGSIFSLPSLLLCCSGHCH